MSSTVLRDYQLWNFIRHSTIAFTMHVILMETLEVIRALLSFMQLILSQLTHTRPHDE